MSPSSYPSRYAAADPHLSPWQTVTSVNPSTKSVILDSGKETMTYDTLVLAPGSTPRRLPIEGADLENVFTFRGLEDSKKVDAGMPPF